MPPQQLKRLLDLAGDGLDLGAHGRMFLGENSGRGKGGLVGGLSKERSIELNQIQGRPTKSRIARPRW